MYKHKSYGCVSRGHNDKRNIASKLTHIRSFYNVRYQIGRKYTYMIINITNVIGLIRNSRWKKATAWKV